MKNKTYIQKGYSVVEVIVALGILVVVLTGVTSLFLSSIGGSAGVDEQLQAGSFMDQGFEAARAIRDNNFANLTIGTHGLIQSGGFWSFTGTSDTPGNFTRTTQISEVRRNEACAIVESGGTVDPDSRKVTVTISWNQNPDTPKSVSANQYLTNWANPQGCGVQANDLILDVHNAYLVQNKKLRGITLQNIGEDPLTVDKITLTWTVQNSLIEWIKIAGAKDWDYGGIGSPIGRQPSGTELNIVDFSLNPGQFQEISEFKFENDMNGSFFTIILTLSDGSTANQNFQVL
ncbi:hypothetical protein KJ951_01910 [Patescibacteria group bacterium]|nr:hypothetical protein [Patescibacteria group bacterium]MBU1703135.1 hypothetical protein [Patescibacteria group bacterium]MBU1954137.1 hypothetical protein [Patescibacteria group bacterium]